MIVTIDGPAGSGKSTAARGLAARLGFRFLDTGAMYRAVAFACAKEGVDTADEESVSRVARQMRLDLAGDRVFIDGSDVTAELRSPEIAQAASIVAVIPAVRGAMAELQRKFARGNDLVTEGRDQGTVVFPEAQCKFFLTADPRERAIRRQIDLENKGTILAVDEVLAELRKRDERDKRRLAAPLKPAPDAIQLDTSRMSAAEVLDELERIVHRRQANE